MWIIGGMWNFIWLKISRDMHTQAFSIWWLMFCCCCCCYPDKPVGQCHYGRANASMRLGIPRGSYRRCVHIWQPFCWSRWHNTKLSVVARVLLWSLHVTLEHVCDTCRGVRLKLKWRRRHQNYCTEQCFHLYLSTWSVSHLCSLCFHTLG